MATLMFRCTKEEPLSYMTKLEVTYISVQGGMFTLMKIDHIWDRVLFSTPYIKIAIPKGNVAA